MAEQLQTCEFLCGKAASIVTIPHRTATVWNLGSGDILEGNESPGVLESLRFIPQGWQTVAGGRSIAETTGIVLNEYRILKGCQKRWNDFRRGLKRSGIPTGCTASFQSFRGSPLRCDPRLLSDIPSG